MSIIVYVRFSSFGIVSFRFQQCTYHSQLVVPVCVQLSYLPQLKLSQ